MSHWTTSGASRLRAKQNRTFGARAQQAAASVAADALIGNVASFSSANSPSRRRVAGTKVALVRAMPVDGAVAVSDTKSANQRHESLLSTNMASARTSTALPRKGNSRIIPNTQKRSVGNENGGLRLPKRTCNGLNESDLLRGRQQGALLMQQHQQLEAELLTAAALGDHSNAHASPPTELLGIQGRLGVDPMQLEVERRRLLRLQHEMAAREEMQFQELRLREQILRHGQQLEEEARSVHHQHPNLLLGRRDAFPSSFHEADHLAALQEQYRRQVGSTSITFPGEATHTQGLPRKVQTGVASHLKNSSTSTDSLAGVTLPSRLAYAMNTAGIDKTRPSPSHAIDTLKTQGKFSRADGRGLQANVERNPKGIGLFTPSGSLHSSPAIKPSSSGSVHCHSGTGKEKTGITRFRNFTASSSPNLEPFSAGGMHRPAHKGAQNTTMMSIHGSSASRRVSGCMEDSQRSSGTVTPPDQFHPTIRYFNDGCEVDRNGVPVISPTLEEGESNPMRHQDRVSKSTSSLDALPIAGAEASVSVAMASLSPHHEQPNQNRPVHTASCENVAASTLRGLAKAPLENPRSVASALDNQAKHCMSPAAGAVETVVSPPLPKRMSFNGFFDYVKAKVPDLRSTLSSVQERLLVDPRVQTRGNSIHPQVIDATLRELYHTNERGVVNDTGSVESSSRFSPGAPGHNHLRMRVSNCIRVIEAYKRNQTTSKSRSKQKNHSEPNSLSTEPNTTRQPSALRNSSNLGTCNSLVSEAKLEEVQGRPGKQQNQRQRGKRAQPMQGFDSQLLMSSDNTESKQLNQDQRTPFLPGPHSVLMGEIFGEIETPHKVIKRTTKSDLHKILEVSEAKLVGTSPIDRKNTIDAASVLVGFQHDRRSTY